MFSNNQSPIFFSNKYSNFSIVCCGGGVSVDATLRVFIIYQVLPSSAFQFLLAFFPQPARYAQGILGRFSSAAAPPLIKIAGMMPDSGFGQMHNTTQFHYPFPLNPNAFQEDGFQDLCLLSGLSKVTKMNFQTRSVLERRNQIHGSTLVILDGYLTM